jgi:hypothetical protein
LTHRTRPGPVQEGKDCFFEKKQQKTFGRFDFGAAGDAQPGRVKSFLVLFFKKAPLPSACLRFGRYSASYLSSHLFLKKKSLLLFGPPVQTAIVSPPSLRSIAPVT